MTTKLPDGREGTDGGGLSGSRIVRVALGYDGDPGAAPESVVVKWTDNKGMNGMPFLLRIFMAAMGFKMANVYRVEHYFLSRARPEVDAAGVRTPRVYSSLLQDATEPSACCYACCDSRSSLVHCAVLEDMRGFRGLTPYSHCPTPEAVAALRNVAALHRVTWGRTDAHAAALEELHLPCCPGFSSHTHNVFGLRGGLHWKEKEKFDELNGAEKVTQIWGGPALPDESSVITQLRQFLTNRSFLDTAEAVARAWPKLRPRLGSVDVQCMVHGDFHQWNQMFRGGTDGAAVECVLLDWQAFGTGRAAYDVAYFLMMSRDFTSIDDDDALLREYHAALTSGDDVVYPLDAFLTDVRLAFVDMGVKTVVDNASSFAGPQIVRDMLDDPNPKIRELCTAVTHVTPRCVSRFAGMHLRHPDDFALVQE